MEIFSILHQTIWLNIFQSHEELHNFKTEIKPKLHVLEVHLLLYFWRFWYHYRLKLKSALSCSSCVPMGHSNFFVPQFSHVHMMRITARSQECWMRGLDHVWHTVRTQKMSTVSLVTALENPVGSLKRKVTFIASHLTLQVWFSSLIYFILIWTYFHINSPSRGVSHLPWFCLFLVCSVYHHRCSYLW